MTLGRVAVWPSAPRGTAAVAARLWANRRRLNFSSADWRCVTVYFVWEGSVFRRLRSNMTTQQPIR